MRRVFAHLAHGGLQQGVDGLLAAQAVDRGVGLDGELGDRAGGDLACFEFGDHAALAGMHHAVVFGIADDDGGDHRRGLAVAHVVQAFLDQAGNLVRQAERAERAAEFQRKGKGGGGIRAPAFDFASRGEENQRAMRLNRTRDVDRFICTVEQVDTHRGAHRHWTS
jgi:hypothetical protein